MTKKTNDDKYPDCFGDLETVFPKGKDNLRTSPDKCIACTHKTQCLKSALNGIGGIKVREELVDRAYNSGVIRFFERWSKKKDLNRKLALKR